MKDGAFKEAISNHTHPKIFLEALNSISSKKFICDSWQNEVLDYLFKEIPENFSKPKNIFIALSGARGCGKSAIAAFIAMWVLSTVTYKKTIITISANTESQIQRSIWNAFLRLFSDLRFDLFLDRSGMNCIYSRYDQDNRTIHQVLGIGSESKMRGLHSEVTVRIFDEACGIDDEVFYTVLSGLTSGVNIVLLMSNPITTRGFFADIFLSSNDYKFYKKNISLLDCEHIDKEDEFFTQHVNSVKRSDPSGDRYAVEILGEFPKATLGFFYDKFEILQYDIDSIPPITRNSTIGIDIAMGTGGDRTVIADRFGDSIFVRFIGNIQIPELSYKVLHMLNITRNICVDSAGVGLGLVQFIRQQGGFVHQVHGASTSSNPNAINKRAELHVQLKSFLDAGGRIFVPYGNKEILEDELRSIKIDLESTKGGKLKICDKKDMKRSPDIVDAITYTFFVNQPTNAPVYFY